MEAARNSARQRSHPSLGARSFGPTRLRATAALGLLLACTRAALAQSLLPSEYVQQLASQSEPLAVPTLIDAALRLSGADGESAGRARLALAGLIDGLQAVVSGEADEALRGERVLVFMHERVLRRYVEEQTRVDVLLAEGTYNCVSSAVLYLILARSVELSVIGVRTRDHAFCAVRVPGRLIDVETTNEYGFDPGEKKQFADRFGRVTGFTYVPANRDPSRSEISERGLMSLILRNRASLATARRQFAAALAAAVDAYALALDEDSRRALVVAVSNQAAALAGAGRFEEALELLDRAAAQYGVEPRFAELRASVVHNQVVDLLKRGELEQAIRIAETARARGELTETGWKELLVSAAQLEAQNAARERGSWEALLVIRAAMGRLGSDARLLESERVYRHNFEVEVHNRMAQAFNGGRYEEARAILELALEKLPGSARLQEDLAAVRRRLESR